MTDVLGYKAAKQFCYQHNKTLTYQQLEPCAKRGRHLFRDHAKFNKFNLIGTCATCGWKQVVDGNI